jgi:hypothetical protein
MKLERSLIAWAVGALVGSLVLILETLGAAVFSWGRLAAYSLAGGVVAWLSRSLLAALVHADTARAGALGAIAAFGSLHALYFVNVRLLPGEHYLSGKSLLVDVVIALPIVVGAVLLGRSGWTQAVRERWGRGLAALGAAALLSAVAFGIATVPRRHTDPQRRGAGPDLVLIVLDSVRADRLPAGSLHPASPELRQHAARGRVFARAWAASSWTVPSVTRILGAEDPGQRPTLTERLAAHGYGTACFTDNPHMASGAKMLRGFDRVERSVGAWRGMILGTALGEAVERLFPGSDERLATKALGWMERQSGPFFLYIHLMDSHTPYRFPPLDGRRRAGRRIEFPLTGMRMTPEEAESIRARYDGGVRSAEAQAARLLAVLTARGRPFLAVITSDHGESLGEGARWFHGHTLAPELLAVPLVVLGDSVEREELSTPVGHAAIAPTLLAAASVPCPDCARADLRRDAGPGTAEGGLPPRLVYRIGDSYKLVLDLETGRRALYDIRSDPAERRDIAALAPEVVKTLASGLSGDTRPPEIAPEQLERLRSLGYSGY